MGKKIWEYSEIDVLERAQKLYETGQIKFTGGWGYGDQACLLHAVAIAGEQLYGDAAGNEGRTVRRWGRAVKWLAKAIRTATGRKGKMEWVVTGYNDQVGNKAGAIEMLKEAQALYWKG